MTKKMVDRLEDFSASGNAKAQTSASNPAVEEWTYNEDFSSFDGASNFAKALGRDGIAHKLVQKNGKWCVLHNRAGKKEDSFQLRDKIGQLERTVSELTSELSAKTTAHNQATSKIDDLRYQIIDLEKRVSNLNELNSEKELLVISLTEKVLALEAGFDEKLKVGLRKAIDFKLLELNERERQLEIEKAQANAKSRSAQRAESLFKLIQEAYSQVFGAARVKDVEERVTTREICTRCGGDGGVNGGCAKCDGTGWANEEKVTTKQVGDIETTRNAL